MRPPRIIIAAASSLTAVLLTVISLRTSLSPSAAKIPSDTSSDPGMLSFYTLRSSLSLFPPNALITLTHDNTTSFLARPAAFGPYLPSNGLKGQMWIGGGFTDSISSGELGCSDMPGWSSSFSNPASHSSTKKIATENNYRMSPDARSTTNGENRDNPLDDSSPQPKSSPVLPVPASSDLTDDHLHHPLHASRIVDPNKRHSSWSNEDHADIQSLQEAAEISGKVVLLSRGGCGFLEKVKWSQRRGAVALIVGDNSKGGPLIQMFARGDTSGITIPSVFTSYTTAHLLYSLVASGTSIEDKIDRDRKSTALKNDMSRNAKVKYDAHSSSTLRKPITKPITNLSNTKKCNSRSEKPPTAVAKNKSGWLKSIFTSHTNFDSNSESSRPPSSGQLDWVPINDLKSSSKPSKDLDSAKQTKKESNALRDINSKAYTEDGFMIGVQDWRDPDLIVTNKPEDLVQATRNFPSLNTVEKKTAQQNANTQAKRKYLGSVIPNITKFFSPFNEDGIKPNSGEYAVRENDITTEKFSKKNTADSQGNRSKGPMTSQFSNHQKYIDLSNPTKNSSRGQTDNHARCDDVYEELWVTLSPSSGVSPFLDTLLVLVVSPLITLTIVYVLLLIRSRYRRQRWRAPKSVVDRLPVRTYQKTVSSDTNSLRLPNISSLSPSTPLLQSVSKSRPRSQTTSAILQPSRLIRNSGKVQDLINHPLGLDIENPVRQSNAWKNQTGTQVECVVCLEEYVDGVSRIMGLPCGHEFHVDCM